MPSVETTTTAAATTPTQSSSAAVEGGTRQDVTDAGCGPHDPALYHYHRIATPCAATLQVSPDIVKQYHQAGYLVFDQAFAAVQADLDRAVQALTTGANKSFAEDVRRQASSNEVPSFTAGQQIAWAQYEAGTVVHASSGLLQPETADKVRKLMGFVGYEAPIDAVVHHPILLQLVAQILDCSSPNELELFQSQALLKPAGGGREKPWHQDNAYFDIGVQDGTAVVGCWIAIDEATPENGCLRMLTGGHKAGPRMHFAVRDYQICDDEILSPSKDTDGTTTSTSTTTATTNIVAIALPPGGMVLFDGMVPHGTPTNLTHQRRRALQFHWIRKGTRRVGEKEPGGRAEVFGGAWNGLTC
eukprot:scaffold16111_cov172-Amphora_coffeaeformis.AAC.2